MPTARSLIEMALKLLGVVPQGQAVEAAEAADGLLHLNAMIEQWRLERLMVYSITRHQMALTMGQQAYTVGAGGQWNMPRPVTIARASMVDSMQDLEQPIRLLTLGEFHTIRIKSTASTWPTSLYYNATYPFGTAVLFPVPMAGGATHSVLYVWAPLSTFALVTTDVALPEGYTAALWYNLAAWMAPMYERPVPDVVAVLAGQTKAAIKRLNHETPLIRSDYPGPQAASDAGFLQEG